jgi:hypothetical protein
MGYGFGVSRSTGRCHKHWMAEFVTDVLGCPAVDFRIVRRVCVVNGPLVSTFRRFPSRSLIPERGDNAEWRQSRSAARRDRANQHSGDPRLPVLRGDYHLATPPSGQLSDEIFRLAV